MDRPFCIVLCPPRSCSSVIAAALGQHPAMHAFAELNLFVCDSMGELLALDAREAQRSGVELTWISGLVRAVAHLEETVRDAPPGEVFQRAREWIEQRADWSTSAMLGHLADRIAPCRGLDKSPRTALARRNIERALEICPSAHVLHLVRHPVATAASLLQAGSLTRGHLDTAGSSMGGPGAAGFALHLWLHTHHALLDLGRRLPADRYLLVQAEAVLGDPARGLCDVAAWLGLPLDAACVDRMLRPQDSPYANTALEPAGGDNDIKFLRDPRLRPLPVPPGLELPADWRVDPWLAGQVRSLARTLGYPGG